MTTEKKISTQPDDNLLVEEKSNKETKNKPDTLIIASKVVNEEYVHQKSSNTPSSLHFFELAKLFAIDGELLPLDDKMSTKDRSTKREQLNFSRKQENIEIIIQKTLSYFATQEIKTKTDHDWFNRYIGLAEDVSNPTMQDLWAKILAKELVKPGSFSFKALKTFRDMSIIDAKLLAKACSLAVKDGYKKNIRLISAVYQQPGLFNFFAEDRQIRINLSKFGLNYSDVLTLAENHLIYMQESELSTMKIGEGINLTFNGSPLKLSARKDKVSLQFYKFTTLGAELANLITDKPNDEFFTYLKNQLSQHFECAQ